MIIDDRTSRIADTWHLLFLFLIETKPKGVPN